MTSRIAAVLVLSVTLPACATTWRERATSETLGCPAAEILISDPTSGALSNTWRAQCQGKVFRCSVPAIAEPDTPPTCKEDPSAPVVAMPKPPAPPPPPAPVAPVAPAAVVEPAAPVPPAPPPSPAATSDLESKLMILKRARDQGLITDKEYEAKKKALLDAF